MILLNPGPVNVSPRVTAALARGDICHREPDYAELIDDVLDDAAAHYPFEIERDGDRRGLVPRNPAGD